MLNFNIIFLPNNSDVSRAGLGSKPPLNIREKFFSTKIITHLYVKLCLFADTVNKGLCCVCFITRNVFLYLKMHQNAYNAPSDHRLYHGCINNKKNKTFLERHSAVASVSEALPKQRRCLSLPHPPEGCGRERKVRKDGDMGDMEKRGQGMPGIEGERMHSLLPNPAYAAETTCDPPGCVL